MTYLDWVVEHTATQWWHDSADPGELELGLRRGAIGVTTKERSALAPDIPSLAESGLPDFDVSAWTGLFVPAGTPPTIIERLNVETRKIAGEQDYVARIQAMGTDVSSSTPEAFGKFVNDDVGRWTAVIRNAGIPKIE